MMRAILTPACVCIRCPVALLISALTPITLLADTRSLIPSTRQQPQGTTPLNQTSESRIQTVSVPGVYRAGAAAAWCPTFG